MLLIKEALDVIIEGIICRFCFEDEQRILNSKLKSRLLLGIKDVCLNLNTFVIFAETCGCSMLDQDCAVKICQSESCTQCCLFCTHLLSLLFTEQDTLSFNQLQSIALIWSGQAAQSTCWATLIIHSQSSIVGWTRFLKNSCHFQGAPGVIKATIGEWIWDHSKVR